jgi:hypothetical protein
MMGREKYMFIEWKIMRSIAKHTAALTSEILEDLKDEPHATTEIFEGIARLMQMDIIEVSLDYFDFHFTPDVSGSRLLKQVKKNIKPNITTDDYGRYGWRTLAGLM